MAWYVLETNPLAETKVQDRITVLGAPTILLRMRRQRRSHHRGVSPYQLIMPRYLFVQLDLPNDRSLVSIIKRYDGVKNWLGINAARETPLAVREPDIARLQQISAELSQEQVEMPIGRPTPLAPETIVRILWAPMDGQTGKIEFDNGIRADVLLAAAGVVSKVSLPRELIEVTQ